MDVNLSAEVFVFIAVWNFFSFGDIRSIASSSENLFFIAHRLVSVQLKAISLLNLARVSLHNKSF